MAYWISYWVVQAQEVSIIQSIFKNEFFFSGDKLLLAFDLINLLIGIMLLFFNEKQKIKQTMSLMQSLLLELQLRN